MSHDEGRLHALLAGNARVQVTVDTVRTPDLGAPDPSPPHGRLLAHSRRLVRRSGGAGPARQVRRLQGGRRSESRWSRIYWAR